MVAPTCPYRKRKTADFTRLRVDSMDELCGLIWCAIAGLFRSRAALQAEILVLRHQLNVFRRRSPRREAVSNVGRLVFVGLYRLPRTCEVGKARGLLWSIGAARTGRRRRFAFPAPNIDGSYLSGWTLDFLRSYCTLLYGFCLRYH